MKKLKLPLILSLPLFLNFTSCDQKEEAPDPSSAPTTQAPLKFETQDVTTDEVQALLKSETPPQVIDLRTPEEFATGHIPGAIMIDFKSPDFKTELAKLDRSKEYIFHCRSGARSTKSIDTWKELGFGKTYHLTTGMNSWTEANKPTE